MAPPPRPLGSITPLWRILRQHVPAQCPLCAHWPVWGQPAGICADCLQHAIPTTARCPRCAPPLAHAQAPCPTCAHTPPSLEHCLAAVDYAYPWHSAIAHFKYQDGVHWAHAFATLLARTPGCQALLTQADAIAPVPLSPTRLRQRGYNQAWAIAQALAQQLGCPHKLLPDALLRLSDTPPQARTGKTARLRNLHSAFAVRTPQRIAGRHIVLIDDVMTTGATLSALAQPLRQAGARAVSAIVFARTPLDDINNQSN